MKSFQLTLSLFLIGLSFQLFAGNATTPIDSTQKALVFSHQYRPVKKYLTVGERVKIRLKNQNYFNRGKIIQITDSTLTIERASKPQTIWLNEIDIIQKTSFGNVFAIYSSFAYSFPYGVAGVAGGVSIFNDSLSESRRGWFVGDKGLGILLTILGLGLLFVSTLPFWARAKRFNLGKKIWKMEVK
jgi:hypothetical protein